jgi:hypothetical protein
MRRRVLVLLSAMALLLCPAVSGAAAPPTRDDGLQTFRKAAWGLTFDCPSYWDESKDVAEPIAVGYLDYESGEVAAFVVARDTAWADGSYSAEEALREVIARVDMPMPRDLHLGERLSRLVSGQKSHGASFSGTDLGSAEAIAGYIYLFGQGGTGWAVAGFSSANAWDSTHRPECDAILKGLVVGAASTVPTRPADRACLTGNPCAVG